MIEFNEWLPDLAEYQTNGVVEAKNTIPVSDGFKEYKSLSTSSTALDTYCRGAFTSQASDKATYSYAGSGTKLYQLVDNTWTDQSKASGTYALIDSDSWEFTKWGETVIAVGGINAATPIPPQIITMGAIGTTEFADLGGSPPQARHVAVVRDFVVLGNIYESTATYPARIRWSGINDNTEWTTNPTAQSDYSDLAGAGGWIRGIRGGEYGVIFQERSIWRMEYVGPPIVFTLDETLPGIGTSAPNAIVQYGDTIFFYGQTGFKAIRNGVEDVEIGRDKINKWVGSNFDASYFNRMVGGFDFRNRRIVWVFPTNSATDGFPDYGVIFDLNSGKWSRFEDDVAFVWDTFGGDYTLEGLDSISANIDTLGESLDSQLWIGGSVDFGGFDSAYKSGSFTGTSLDAVFETSEKRLTPGRTNISRVMPIIDEPVGDITIAIGHRDSTSDNVVWTDDRSRERDQTHAFRVDSRYQRFRVKVPSGFKYATGIAVIQGSPSSGY